MSKKVKIAELARKITQARADYYNQQPTMSDDAFDALYDELKKLDPTNEAITAIGAPIANKNIYSHPTIDGRKLRLEAQKNNFSPIINLINNKVREGSIRNQGATNFIISIDWQDCYPLSNLFAAQYLEDLQNALYKENHHAISLSNYLRDQHIYNSMINDIIDAYHANTINIEISKLEIPEDDWQTQRIVDGLFVAFRVNF